MQERANDVITKKIFWAVFLIGIAWLVFVFTEFPKQAWVEGLLESWYVSKGLVHYRDFTSRYFPVLYLLMVPFHRLFGFSQIPTIWLALINSFVIYLIIAILSWKWLRGWFRLLPLILFLLWNPVLAENHFLTPSFHALMNLIAFASWISWLKSPKPWLALILGLSLGLAVMSMQLAIPFAGSIVVSLLLSWWQSRKNRHEFQQRCLGLFLSLLTFFIPVIYVVGWFMQRNALYDFYYWTINYYFFGYPFASMGREVGNIYIFLAVFGSFIPMFLSMVLPKLERNMFSSFNLSQRILVLLALFILPLTYWFTIFHYLRFQMGLSIYCLILGLSLQTLWLNRKIGKQWFSLFLSLTVLFNVLAFIKGALPRYKFSFLYPKQNNVLTEIYENDPVFNAIDWIVKNTPVDARLFVIADPVFYIKTDRLPAHSLGTMNQPFVYLPLEKFSITIQQKIPDYWVVDERLLNQRFLEYGYQNVTDFFNKLLACEPAEVKFEYVTIRKHSPGQKLCL